jgi:hypothetical protein
MSVVGAKWVRMFVVLKDVLHSRLEKHGVFYTSRPVIGYGPYEGCIREQVLLHMSSSPQVTSHKAPIATKAVYLPKRASPPLRSPSGASDGPKTLRPELKCPNGAFKGAVGIYMDEAYEGWMRFRNSKVWCGVWGHDKLVSPS